MTRIQLLIFTVIVAPLLAPIASAQSDEPQIESIRQAAAQYLKARENGDRDALLALWTKEGRFVDFAGHSHNAHAMIESQFEPGAVTRRHLTTISDESIRMVTANVAIHEGASTVKGTPGEPETMCQFTAIWVKRTDRWQLDNVRESLLPTPARNSRLTELRWLLGSFAGLADDDSQIVVTAELSPDRNFVLREFVVKSPEGKLQTIHQRIGWDPLAHGFRSWTFDSAGGYSGGNWQQEANSWIVHNSGFTSDGKRCMATMLMTDIKEESYMLEIVGAIFDNQVQPDMKVLMSRQIERDE